MRRAARTDAAHASIRDALRKAGAYVIDTSALPGFVDLVVGWQARTCLLEVKRPTGPKGGKSGHGRQLTPDQATLHECWTGGTLAVVDSAEAALRVLGVMARSSGVDIDAIHRR